MTPVFIVELDPSEDGRGSYRIQTITSNLTAAKEIAISLEPYGFEGQFTRIVNSFIFSSYDDWKKYIEEKTRQDALKKLTEKEKKALGLYDS